MQHLTNFVRIRKIKRIKYGERRYFIFIGNLKYDRGGQLWTAVGLNASVEGYLGASTSEANCPCGPTPASFREVQTTPKNQKLWLRPTTRVHDFRLGGPKSIGIDHQEAFNRAGI
jgi:hypothetical protein